jgi:hypothetical protein
MTKFYIMPHRDAGEGMYYVVSSKGVLIYSTYAKSGAHARTAIYDRLHDWRRTGMQHVAKAWNIPVFLEIYFVGDEECDLTEEDLFKLMDARASMTTSTKRKRQEEYRLNRSRIDEAMETI